MKRYIKDPNATKDYKIDWSAFLGADDTLATSTWTPVTGITVTSTSSTTTDATVWVSGGTAGQEYGVTNHIATVGGRVEDETLYFVIVDK